MKLLIFSEDQLAINIDRIDGFVPAKHQENNTAIYVGGSDEPYIVSKTFDEVAMLIRERT